MQRTDRPVSGLRARKRLSYGSCGLRRVLAAACLVLALFGVGGAARAQSVRRGQIQGRPPGRFIILNGVEPTAQAFREIDSVFGERNGPVALGVGCIISYLNLSAAAARERLEKYLRLSRRFRMPLVIQLDGEQWWGGRPDLWNWWDPSRPGYAPANKRNVEWTGWTPDSAVRIGWRNWGRQLRVLPMPNLASPAYRKACHEALARLVPLIVQWGQALPPAERDLWVGVKVGWESAIGVNNWYYPGGNRLARLPESGDPRSGLTLDSLPSRGVETIGYAAVKTWGIAAGGRLTEADLTEVVHRHLEDLSAVCAGLGVPRAKLFTHAGGWAAGETLYTAALNPYACPGWSFYTHAGDPREDTTAMRALSKSDAPYWGAVEWLYGGDTPEGWKEALVRTLSVPRIRYLCIYNWSGIRNAPTAINAIRTVLADAGTGKSILPSGKARLTRGRNDNFAPQDAQAFGNE